MRMKGKLFTRYPVVLGMSGSSQIMHFEYSTFRCATVAMPEEGNKRYLNILEPYKINCCQQKGDCVKVETVLTRV